MKRIAVICERDRAYGRGVCLGISDAAGQEKDWSLEFIDDIETVKETRLSGFDGVIARVVAIAATVCVPISAMAQNECRLTFSGYEGSETLKDFPALIKIPDGLTGFDYADTAENGRDIAFFGEDAPTRQ